jgi:hypothetical protein
VLQEGDEHRRDSAEDRPALSLDQAQEEARFEGFDEHFRGLPLQWTERAEDAPARVECREGIHPYFSLLHAEPLRGESGIVRDATMAKNSTLGEACGA